VAQLYQLFGTAKGIGAIAVSITVIYLFAAAFQPSKTIPKLTNELWAALFTAFMKYLRETVFPVTVIKK
jgi:hypothetical protein